ncbi:MAG: response regulator transcription factor [Bacteroidota bacterium]
MFNLAVKYGLALGVVLIVVKLSEHFFLSGKLSMDIYFGIVAGVFLLLGSALGYRGKKEKVIIREIIKAAEAEKGKPQQPLLDSLSDREKEVLQLLSKGFSNQEIANQLFVSLNTIKTHVKNIYAKLDVNRRVQAISKAKDLNIIE